MSLRDYVTVETLAQDAADDVETAWREADNASDPGLMAHAQIVATLALSEAVLALVNQIAALREGEKA